MYTYPEYLNACQRIAIDLLHRAYEKDPKRFPWEPKKIICTVAADSVTGTASVDWRKDWGRLHVTVNMPVKAATYMVTEQEFQHGVAYLLHEVGHPLHTDKAVWDIAVATKRQTMLNYTDDVRQEKATIDLGLAVNATKMFGGLIDSLHAKAVAKGYDPNDIRSIGWTLATLGRKANGYEIDTSDIDAKLDPASPVATILAWALPDLKACVTTQDCLDLADKVTAAIRAANKPTPTPKPEPLPEPHDDVAEVEPVMDDTDWFDEAEAETETETEVEAEAEAEAEDQTEFEAQHTQKGEADDGAEDSKGPTLPGRRNDLDDGDDKEPEPKVEVEPEVPADDLVDDVDMTPNTSEVVTSSSRSYVATKRVLGVVRRALEHPKQDQPIAGRAIKIGYDHMSGTHYTTVDLVTRNASKMGRQRALLAAAMKREESDDFEGGLTSGRLNRRAMARLTIGSPNVFGKRTLTEGYDTDVQVLIDGSSSMTGNSILAAATLGLVVSQAASQVGVECAAHVFNEKGLFAITKGRAKPVYRRFAYAYNAVEGSTPLTENLVAAALEQKRRAPNKRRILFVITDGGCDLGPDVVKAAGHYIERTVGAEIANLHIGYKPMGLFRNECAVNVTDVASVGVQALTGTLERGVR